MTRGRSDAQRRKADRLDGARRRGPRTRGGKERVARNAIRHGLSLSVLADPATAAAVEVLARQMSPAADAQIGELARAVAQAQVDLVRVRRARHDLLAVALTHLTGGAQAAVADQPALASTVPHVAVQLAAMDRYERRALSRRKFAIRTFDAARRSAHAGKIDA